MPPRVRKLRFKCHYPFIGTEIMLGRLTVEKIAETLKCTTFTVKNKLYYNGKLTLKDAEKIQAAFFPDVPPELLIKTRLLRGSVTEYRKNLGGKPLIKRKLDNSYNNLKVLKGE